MNYIRELNAFYDWLQCNRLSTTAELLYHTLLMVNNRVGWTEWFQQTNQALAGLMGISVNTLKRARAELKQKGFIDFRPSSKKNEVTTYKILGVPSQTKNKVSNFDTQVDTQVDTQNLKVSNFDTQSDTQPDTQVDTQPDTQPDTQKAAKASVSKLPEHPKHKHKQKQENNIVSSTNVEETPDGQEKQNEKITNASLIAELVQRYREVIPPEKHQRGDYPFLGRLYNEYGYDVVLTAINELGYRVESGFVPEQPLVYLKAIAKGGTENRAAYKPIAQKDRVVTAADKWDWVDWSRILA